jgi:hypothetical protein
MSFCNTTLRSAAEKCREADELERNLHSRNGHAPSPLAEKGRQTECAVDGTADFRFMGRGVREA